MRIVGRDGARTAFRTFNLDERGALHVSIPCMGETRMPSRGNEPLWFGYLHGVALVAVIRYFSCRKIRLR